MWLDGSVDLPVPVTLLVRTNARRPSTTLCEIGLSNSTMTQSKSRRSKPAPSREQNVEFEPAFSYLEHKQLVVAAFQRAYLTWLLARHDGNLSACSRESKQQLSQMRRMMKRHGISRAERGKT